MYVAKPPKLANGTIPPQAIRDVVRQQAFSLSCAVALLAAGCSPASNGPQPASPTTYPDLASVPPRPVLGTLADRQAIQHQLVAARRDADFRAAELAYETGRAAEPPPRPSPAAAPPTAAAPGPPRPGGGGAVARAYLDSSLNDIRDRGKLRQFMRRLGREAPDPFGPQTLAQAVGLTPTPPERGVAAAGPQPGTFDHFSDFLRGALGFGDDSPDPPPD